VGISPTWGEQPFDSARGKAAPLWVTGMAVQVRIQTGRSGSGLFGFRRLGSDHILDFLVIQDR
jgi:hypothetical protein